MRQILSVFPALRRENRLLHENEYKIYNKTALLKYLIQARD